ncbi:POM121-like protein 2 [Sciurus carolinensis]|uniref:POM121-like protein 2 n=1 Tax=Sciurus carolinensis TaxID=30640 RepID=UPI001FB3C713|nr:POM121-like protein 2 [Sciurus carolinensis]
MGSFLGKPGPSASPASAPADSPERPRIRRPAPPLCHVQRVQYIHRAHPAPRRRPARRPPNWDPAHPSRGVNEAWRRFPMNRFQNSVMGPLPSDWWESYLKRTIWSLRHPRAVWSPVTVKISPPGQRAPPSVSSAGVIASAGPSEVPPDPCAKETVLRALRQCRRGSARVREPPLPRSSDAERSREIRPSAFKPLAKQPASAYLVPRPGLLKRSFHSWSSGHSLRRSGCCSESCSAGRRTGGPLCAKRNAISSSYSSSRDFTEPWRRSFPSTSIQTPEWPVKRKEKGHQYLSPVPLVSDSGSPGAPDSGEQHRLKVPLLFSRPGNLLSTSSAPQLGCAGAGKALALGKEAGPQWGDKTRENTALAWAGSPHSLPFTVPPPEAAATTSMHQLDILKMQKSPGPLAFPGSPGEATHVAQCSQKTPSLPALAGCSHSEPPPETSTDAKPTATCILLTPASPTSPATDTAGLPSIPQADRSAMPLDPPVVTLAAPTLQVATHNHESGARGSVFGSTAPRPFAFGGLVTPMDCGESGVLVSSPDSGGRSFVSAGWGAWGMVFYFLGSGKLPLARVLRTERLKPREAAGEDPACSLCESLSNRLWPGGVGSWREERKAQVSSFVSENHLLPDALSVQGLCRGDSSTRSCPPPALEHRVTPRGASSCPQHSPDERGGTKAPRPELDGCRGGFLGTRARRLHRGGPLKAGGYWPQESSPTPRASRRCALLGSQLTLHRGCGEIWKVCRGRRADLLTSSPPSCLHHRRQEAGFGGVREDEIKSNTF